ncbi:hypothetical protein G3480_15035 [Thiorhodococcus mannitoliphagus]|uniref:Uncharacterized protein n=1 Tax=Thiorhodococcus mannitoliphagus TaxID=329406 RepID=A0A6P1DV47_9GAMM|nr:hypothetical protein [Thiorhodococcus mannitoliphagus]NEX21609.1 hypothetical protein [Thiorhodococcus mannitoliphagus]
MFLRNRHSLWLRLVMVLGAMALFVLGYQWGNRHQQGGDGPTRINGVLVRPVGAIPNFALRDALGQAFDQTHLASGWTLMAFGDLAQASGQRSVQRLVDAYNRVADQPQLRRSLQLVLVTTREAPSLARNFARLSPALHILGGDGEEIDRLQAALGLADDAAPTLFLFGPGGYLVALLPAQESGQAVAEDLKAVYADASTLLPEQP